MTLIHRTFTLIAVAFMGVESGVRFRLFSRRMKIVGTVGILGNRLHAVILTVKHRLISVKMERFLIAVPLIERDIVQTMGFASLEVGVAIVSATRSETVGVAATEGGARACGSRA